MSLIGLAVLAAGAIPHIATTVISDLYHGTGTEDDLRPVLIIAWEVTQGWVDTFVVTGIVLTPIGLLLYDLAMLCSQEFASWTGWASLGLGLAGIYAAVASLIEESEIVGVGIFALVFFHLLIGWRSFQLSRLARWDPRPRDNSAGLLPGFDTGGGTAIRPPSAIDTPQREPRAT